MPAEKNVVELDFLEKRLKDWQYYAIEDTWSAHTPGVWVAKFISPDAAEGQSYCCVSLEIGEYLALFFSPKKSGLGWELVEMLSVKKNMNEVQEWLESIEVD